MNWGAWLGLTAIFAALMLIVQRTEARRRRIVFVVMLVGAELVRRYLVYRDWNTEGLLAVLMALVIAAAFWLAWGRKHPPRSSEEEIDVAER